MCAKLLKKFQWLGESFIAVVRGAGPGYGRAEITRKQFLVFSVWFGGVTV